MDRIYVYVLCNTTMPRIPVIMFIIMDTRSGLIDKQHLSRLFRLGCRTTINCITNQYTKFNHCNCLFISCTRLCSLVQDINKCMIPSGIHLLLRTSSGMTLWWCLRVWEGGVLLSLSFGVKIGMSSHALNGRKSPTVVLE